MLENFSLSKFLPNNYDNFSNFYSTKLIKNIKSLTFSGLSSGFWDSPGFTLGFGGETQFFGRFEIQIC